MTTDEPNIPLTSIFPIGKAAEILGIDRSTLRRHTDMGLIRFIVSRANGRKRYEGKEIIRYWRMNA